MRNLLKVGIFVFFLCVPQGTFAAAGADGESCDCPKLSCNPECEIEQDLTFYTEKCAGGSRVKSCSRPTCVKLANAPASCSNPNKVALQQQPQAAADMPKREIASATERAVIGRIKFIEERAWKVGAQDNKQTLSVGDDIFENDRIATDGSGRLQILFSSGNVLNITPNSEVEITDASDSMQNQAKKQMILNLIKGRIRNKVNLKCGGNEVCYRVRTQAAVAGVRGTDFVVSAFDESEETVAKVEAFGGHVDLLDRKFEKQAFDGKESLTAEQKKELKKNTAAITSGEGATFVIPRNARSVAADKAEFVSGGKLSPVYKMTDEQFEKLENETSFALLDSGVKSRKSRIKNSDTPICANPNGAINQCAWTCENNPANEKTCRTDLPEVSCVRRICNANGVWSQATRLPATYRESCRPDRPVVKPCDY